MKSYYVNPDNLDFIGAVREGLTDMVREMLNADPSLAGKRVVRETESSKYREWCSPAEYEDAESALAIAARKGWRDIVRLLLERGAGPNLSWDGGSAMASAKRCGDPEILKLLIDAGGADDGSPLTGAPFRTEAERVYGRGGNVIASMLAKFAEDTRSKRRRDMLRAVTALADMEAYRLIDRTLALLGAPDMSDFILHHEKYAANAAGIAGEDIEFIMGEPMDCATYLNLMEGTGARAQWRFIGQALWHEVYNRRTLSKGGAAVAPVLKDFCKETYGDLFDPGADRPLYVLYGRLLAKYAALYPVPPETAPARNPEDYSAFERLKHAMTDMRGGITGSWAFGWEPGDTAPVPGESEF